MRLIVADTAGIISEFNPTTDMQIERLYDGSSAILSQQPSGLDSPLEIQFGAAEGTPSDPIQTLVRGGNSEASILRINQAGTYRLKTSIQFGRTGGAGTSQLNFRALINGVQAGRSQLNFRALLNGVQAGRSISGYLANANVLNLLVDEAWLTLPAGLDITYELIRDSNGNDSGGLFAGETSGSTGWNPSPAASVRVERWIGV